MYTLARRPAKKIVNYPFEEIQMTMTRFDKIMLVMTAYVAWGRGISMAGLVSFGGGWPATSGGDICNSLELTNNQIQLTI